MSVRLRHVAPAGVRISGGDLVRWAAAGLSGQDAAETLARAIGARFGVSHTFLASSGRAGLTTLLRALRRLAPSHRDHVILPSYTCYSVAAAIVKAGLRPRVVDIVPETLDFDRDLLARSDFNRVLAVIACNLYGLPGDMPALSALARERGVFLIDDAAQAMGATVAGRWSGTWGDAGLFSLDKGKNVTSIKGGAIVTSSDDIAAAVREEQASLQAPPAAETCRSVFTGVATWALLRPWLYWIPNAIPQLGLGQTIYSTDFSVTRPSGTLAALGGVTFAHLDALTRSRRAHAEALRAGIKAVTGVTPIEVTPASAPVYVRLPLLFKNEAARRRVHDRLNAAGIGASESYPGSIADIDEVRDLQAGTPCEASGGRYVARHILTLPTHSFVTSRDVVRTIGLIADDAVAASSAVMMTT